MSEQITLFKPDYIVTPGEILEETLEARGIKKNEFAERCGRTAKMISEIIAGKAAITPETALQFERVLGVSANLWSNLESRYRLKLAEQEDQEDLEKHVEVIKKFPINDLVKFGFIRKTSVATEKLSGLLEFFGVGNVDALCNWSSVKSAQYRSSQAFSSDEYAVAAWLRCGQIVANKIVTKPYNAEQFKEALKEIRLLSREKIEVFKPRMVELCANAGVALVFIPELKGTKLSGAARWLTKDKALIQLSLRHKSDDHLWFTFFHEAGHILLHGKKELFVDEVKQIESEQEKEADDFAEEILISKGDWHNFKMTYASFPKKIIEDFAESQGISPGIVLGRLQHEKFLPYNTQLNRSLKRKYEWTVNSQ